MKKIFLLTLLSVLFVACGDDDSGEGKKGNGTTPPPGVDVAWLGDWNDRNDPAFKPEYDKRYCLLAGEWQVITKNGKPYSDILIYKMDLSTWFVATSIKSDNVPSYSVLIWSLIYNDKQIKDKATGRIFEYQLRVSETEDKLVIFDGRDTFECEPYKYSEYKKFADWNSFWDRHYQIYKGKYNPVKGKWKIVTENEEFVSSEDIYYYEFSDDFYLVEHPYTPYFYSINNSYVYINATGMGVIDYKISNDTLYWKLYKGKYYRTFVKVE